MRLAWILASSLCTALTPSWAHAQETEASGKRTVTTSSVEETPARPEEADDEERAYNVPLAVSAALVPGILVHGSGHFAAGDRKTARRLLLLEGMGLGMAAVGGLSLGLTGANRHINGSSIPLLVSGIGVFALSWIADVYGVSTAGTRSVYRQPPPVAITLGYGYVRDPQFSYDHFSVTRAEMRLGDVLVESSLWAALTADNQRGRVMLRYPLVDDWHGLRLQLAAGGTMHRFGDDGFTSYVGEVAPRARWDLAALSDTLAGSYLTMDVGIGYQLITYRMSGIDSDGSALLLSRWGYGFYLPAGGELELYYDHRRDNFTAGASPSPANGSGFMGQWGLRLRQPISSHLALRLETEIASAWLSTLGLETRWGQ